MLAQINDNIVTIADTCVSNEKFETTVDGLTDRMKVVNDLNLLVTKDMCQEAYDLAMENTKSDIEDVYYSLNLFQRLLWRILGLKRLWKDVQK